MFKVVSDRVAVRAQWSVVRVSCIQCLTRVHRLTAAVAPITRSQPLQQGSTHAVMAGAVPALVPAASGLVSGSAYRTGAVRAPGVGAGGEPAASAGGGAEAWP